METANLFNSTLKPRELIGSGRGGLSNPIPDFVRPRARRAKCNAKFMSGQFVVRGGSCVTPPDHLRASYRNFFPPATRWQFSGVRLAEDL
jgi:formylglycine-generating enzyme required for sulfatase activity